MTSSASPISRTQSPVERGSQRAERAPAGDFAALLELAPRQDRASVSRADERGSGEPSQSSPRERRQWSSESSRQGEPASGRPESPRGRDSASGRDVPASARGQALRDGGTTERSSVNAGLAQESTPTPADTALQPGAPVSVDGTAAIPVAAFVPAAADPLVTPVAGESLPGAQSSGVAASVAEGALSASGAPLSFALVGLPAGSTPAGSAPAVAGAGSAAGAEAVVATTTAVAVENSSTGMTATAPLPGAVAPEAPAGAVVDTASAGVGEPVVAGPTVLPAGGSVPEAPAGQAAGEASMETASAATSGGSSGSADSEDGEGASAASRTETVPAASATAASEPAAATVGTPATARLLDGIPLGPHREVPLERASRAVAQLLHVGSQGGISHARIALRPVELGGIEIFLQVSPAGLTAQVIAESPEAARMLQQATEDLRRSLAGHDVELISLDVSTSSEQQQRDDLASRDGVADFGAPDRSARRDSGVVPADSDDPTSTTPTVLELPDGLLVDVLA